MILVGRVVVGIGFLVCCDGVLGCCLVEFVYFVLRVGLWLCFVVVELFLVGC